MDSHWERELGSVDGVAETQTLPASVDVIIIGAGLTGVSLAYHLARCAPTQTVAVLEARGIGRGASGRNGGIVWPDASEEFEVRNTVSMRAALAEHGIDAEWAQRGGISVVAASAANDDSEDALIDGVCAIDPVAELGAAPSAFRAAYRDDLPAAVSGAKLVCGLARATLAIAAASSGGSVTFVAPCRVENIDASASGVRVTTNLGETKCGRIVVATNGWIPRILRSLRPHFRAAANTVLVSSVVPPALRWPCAVLSCGDGASEVYASTTRDGRIVIGGLRDSGPGTRGHSGGSGGGDGGDGGQGGGGGGGGGAWAFAGYDRAPHDRKIANDLEQWLARCFPTLAAAITFDRALAWRGILGFPRDGKPIVGEMPGRHRRVYVCGGFSGHGMPQCWGLAKALAQHLAGVPVEDAATLVKFNVARFFRPATLAAYLERKQSARARNGQAVASGAASVANAPAARCPFEVLLQRLDSAPKTRLAPPRYAAHPFVRRMQRGGPDALWAHVPAELRPGGSRSDSVPAVRALRKRAQLENVLAAAIALLPSAASGGATAARSVCVDFCSGTGHAGLLVAWALPHTNVVLVDCNTHALAIAARRAKAAGLTNVFCVNADVKRTTMADILAEIDDTGDGSSGEGEARGSFGQCLGIALHACGAATDGAQRCCVDARVPFLLVPCCVGRLSHATGAGSTAKASRANTKAKAAAARAAADAGIIAVESDYPKSRAIRAVLSSDDYDVVARAADFALTPNNRLLRDAYTPRELNRRRCKAWLELDRQLWAVEAVESEGAQTTPLGEQQEPYQTLTFLMEPHDASPKNDMLLGWCDGKTVAAVVAEGRVRVDALMQGLCPEAALEEGWEKEEEEKEKEAHAWMLPAIERV